MQLTPLIITPQMLTAEERTWSLDQVNALLTVRASTQIAAGAFGNSQVFSSDSLIELNGKYKSVSGVFTLWLWFNHMTFPAASSCSPSDTS